MRLTGIAAALMLFFGLFMFNAYSNANKARREAVQNSSAMLMNTALDDAHEGDRIKAVLVARRAFEALEPDMETYAMLKDRYKYVLNESLHQNGIEVQTSIYTDNFFTFSAISPDSKTIAAGLSNDRVAFWDIASGGKLRELGGFNGQVKLLTYSSDGQLFAASSLDNQVKIWETAEFNALQTLDIEGVIMLIEFSKDGRYLFLAENRSDASIFKTYKVEDWSEVSQINLPSSLRRIVFNPISTEVIALYNESLTGKSLSAYDFISGQKIYDFPIIYDEREGVTQGQPMPYTELRVDPEGRFIFAANDTTLYKFDSLTKQPLYAIPINPAQRMMLSADGSEVIMATANNPQRLLNSKDDINVFSSETGELQYSFYLSGLVQTIVPGKDEMFFVLLDNGQIITIDAGKILSSNLNYGSGQIADLDVAKNGEYLALISHNEQFIKVAKLGKRNMLENVDGQLLAASENQAFSLYFADGNFFVIDNSSGQKVTVYSPPKSKDSSTLAEQYKYTSFKADISNDGKKMAYIDFAEREGGDVFDLIIRLEVVQFSDGKQLYRQDAEIDDGEAFFAITPDSNALYIQKNDGTATIVDLDSSEASKNYKLYENKPHALQFTEDARFFCVSYKTGNYQIYDAADGKVVDEGNGHILAISNENGQLTAKGLYNNQTFLLANGKQEPLATIGNINRSSSNLFEDVNTYFPASDLLLSIVKLGNSQVAYLYDFSSGALIQRISINVRNYPAFGFVSEDGKILTVTHDFSTVVSGDFANTKAYNVTARYKILDEEALFQDAQAYTAERELTDEELRNLGIVR